MRTRPTSVLPSVIALLLWGSGSSAQAPPAADVEKPVNSLRGTVTDPSGNPLPEATVRAVLAREDTGGRRPRASARPVPVVARTLENGSFHISDLDPGTYDLRVEAAGFAASRNEGIPLGATVRVRMKTGVPLRGQVFDLEARRPVPGATVRVWDPGARSFGKEAASVVRADDDGRFLFENLPTGTVRLEAWGAGKALERLDDVVVEAQTDDEAPGPGPSIFLRPGARLAGRILDGAGRPVENARVTLETSGSFLSAIRGGGGREEWTDEAGRFDFEGILAKTRASLAATKEGYARAESDPVLVEAGRDRVDLELKLGVTAALAFGLIDENDRPVTDVELRLEETGTRAGGRRARAMGGGRVVPEDRIEIGQEGNVRVRDLDPGRFDVTVLPWGYAEIQREGVRLKAGETSDLGILRVREGNFVSGRVVDPEGSPVGSARVFALWMDGDRPRTRVVTARADGTWKLAGLGEAPLRQLRAFARGYSAEEKSGALPGDRNVDFVLEPAGVVLGRVIRPDGTAPPAFRVKVHEEAGSRPETGFMRRLSFAGDGEEVFADPTGNFRLDTVEPGTVTLEATAEGWAPARKTGVQVASGVETEAGTLVLDPGRTLRGRILDARDDVPLPGAVVTVLTAQGPMRFRFGASSEPTAISDMGGVFRLSGLESRAYTAIVDHSDYAPYQTQVEIPEDEDPPELVVRLGRGGVLTGTVRDASKQPVEGANLIAMLGMMEGDLREAATGPDGVYRFEGLAPGTYRVMRTPSGDRLVVGLGMKQAIVREGETTVLDFDEIAPITLRGTVLRGGNPVPGATLVFAQGTGAFPMGDVKSASSGADGRYEVGLEASGAYTVIVQSEGLSRRGSSVEILVPEGPQPVVDIVLRVGSISGRVVNESAEPVAGAIVSARRGDDGAPGGFGSGVGTRPDGTFTLDSLEDGAYRITASAAGYETGEAGPILVQDGTSDAEVEIRLETGRTIRGVVLDPRGGPVQGASVAAFPSGSSDAPFLPSSTDVNGAFVLTAPSDGPIDLVAVARGYAPARASGIVPEETADGSGVVLRVSSGGRIRIRVVDGSGAPVVGARVSVSASPPYPGSSLAVFVSGNLVTGPEGSATATSLAPGSYAVVAESAGQRTQRTVSVAEGQETDVTLTTSIVR